MATLVRRLLSSLGVGSRFYADGEWWKVEGLITPVGLRCKAEKDGYISEHIVDRAVEVER